MTTTNRRLLIAANIPVDILRKFTFDTTGGNANINTCTARIKRLRGNTIVWNQLVTIQSTIQSKTQNDVTFTDNRDGSYTVSTTASGAAATTRLNMLARNVVNGHKYLIKGCPKNGSSSSYYLHVGSFGDDIGNGLLFTCDYDYPSFSFPRISVFTGYVISTPIVFRPIMFDLTLMFGAGNEPATVAEFEALFPLDYYDYNAGQLLSFTGDDIKTTGFNQWDEQWELGEINADTGANTDTSIVWRSKNYIPILPNTSYYIYCALQRIPSLRARFYDANKNYIGYLSKTGQQVFFNSVFTTPTNAHYLRFAPLISAVPTGTQVCLNISHSTRNGTYEPYIANTKDISFYKSIRDANDNILFPYGLLSAGNVYDEVTATKAIKRIGVVDLGSLNWVYGHNSDSTIYFFYIDSLPTKLPSFKNVSQSLINPKYDKYLPDQYNGSFNAPNKTISQRAATFAVLYIRDDSYTDAAAFKTAMNGVMLYYELAEPIEVSLDNINLEYPAYRTGTEELLPANGAVPTTTPTLFNIRYKIGGRRN